MTNIKVLWMDDEPNNAFIACGEEEGLDIEQVYSVNEGKELLGKKKWDAIILDVYNKTNNRSHEVVSIGAFWDSFQQMNDSIPYFIYTGGGPEGKEVVSTINKKDYQDKVYFDKPSDRDKLFDNIKRAVADSPRYIARTTYSDICDFYKEDDLVDLLVELIEDRVKTDEMVPAKVRNILSWIMPELNKQCVLPIKLNENRTNLAECSRFLGFDKMKPIVPLHVQRHLYSIVSIANEGAHRNDEKMTKTQTQIKNGEAPYLNVALIYEMIDILKWCASLNSKERERRRKQTIDILKKYRTEDGFFYSRIEGDNAIFKKNNQEKEIKLAYIE